LIVFEAAGAYHRSLEKFLTAHDLPFVKVNPKQAGGLRRPSGNPPRRIVSMRNALAWEAPWIFNGKRHWPKVCTIREMLTARRALVKDQNAAKARLATATVPLIRRQLRQRLVQIERDVGQIDREMADRAGRDTKMAERIGILTSIPGVGLLTAITSRDGGHEGAVL
jgi:transposase